MTPGGPVPRVDATLRPADRRGAALVRLRIRRNEYKVDPGLYALGAPTAAAPVLVTANYKLTFDTLRAALPGLDAWLLVLDTAGINVWCAAGKGTFGTAELCARVQAAGLSEVVAHRVLTLPQLGAPGVTAREVRAATGFRVRWGPVEARDLPAVLAADGRVPPAQRLKRFPLRERAALIPVELVGALGYALPAVALLGLAAALLLAVQVPLLPLLLQQAVVVPVFARRATWVRVGAVSRQVSGVSHARVRKDLFARFHHSRHLRQSRGRMETPAMKIS